MIWHDPLTADFMTAYHDTPHVCIWPRGREGRDRKIRSEGEELRKKKERKGMFGLKERN